MPITCHVTLIGEMTSNGDIVITNGSVSSGAASCSSINLRLSTSTPWTADYGADYTAPANPPGTGIVSITLNGLNVDGPFGPCTGGTPTSTTIDYGNSNPTSLPSFFGFAGSSFGACAIIAGTLEVQNAGVNVFTP